MLKLLSRHAGEIERTLCSGYAPSLCILNKHVSLQCVVYMERSLTERSILPIPDPYGLVIRAGQYPWQFMVKEDCAYIVQVAIEGKETSPALVRPDLDFVIIPTRDEEGLSFVEVNASNRTVVLLEAIDQGTHPVIP